MVIRCLMQHALTHKFQLSGPTAHSYTVSMYTQLKYSNYTRMKSYWLFTIIKTDKMLSDVLDPARVVNVMADVSCF